MPEVPATPKPTSVEIAAAKEAVPELHTALRMLGIALAVTLATAIGEFINNFLPAISAAITPYLPAWAVGGGSVVTVVLGFVAAGLIKWAKKKAESAGVTALRTDTPDALVTDTRSKHYDGK